MAVIRFLVLMFVFICILASCAASVLAASEREIFRDSLALPFAKRPPITYFSGTTRQFNPIRSQTKSRSSGTLINLTMDFCLSIADFWPSKSFSDLSITAS